MKKMPRIRLCVEELEGRLVPSTLSSSTNWSGYAVTASAGTVTQVAGSWVVPAVSTSVSGYSSAWVGIDGFNSSTVEQIGTDSDYIRGHAQYYAWYEMYPAPMVKLSMAINPGDTIAASVTYGSNGFTLSITDVTTGATPSPSIPVQTSSAAQLSSAEWVLEAPSSITGVLPLANFGTINFSGANATVNGTNSLAEGYDSTLYQINMVNRNGTLKAQTSSLDVLSTSASNFTVTWKSSGSTGGGGNGKKASNMSPPVAPQSVSFPPAPGASVAVNIPVASLAFVTTEPVNPSVPTRAATALFTPLTASAATATVGHFKLDSANLGDQVDEQVDTPKLSLPNGATCGSGVASDTDDFSAPQADETPASLPGASLERSQASAVILADGLWLPSVSFESPGALSGEAGDSAIAGLVLALALELTPYSANEQTRKRNGVQSQFGDLFLLGDSQ